MKKEIVYELIKKKWFKTLSKTKVQYAKEVKLGGLKVGERMIIKKSMIWVEEKPEVKDNVVEMPSDIPYGL